MKDRAEAFVAYKELAGVYRSVRHIPANSL